MKITIAILIVCSLQNSAVLAKTIDDVLEDFLPVLQLLHHNLAMGVDRMYRPGLDKVNNYEDIATREGAEIEGQWDETLAAINSKLQDIVTETGMTSQPELIQHCYAQKDSDYGHRYQMERSALEVMKSLTEATAEEFREVLSAIKGLQTEIHTEIDEGVAQCKAKSKTPFDMQVCLLDHIFITASETIAQRLKLVEEQIEIVVFAVEVKSSSVQEGFHIIQNRAAATQKPVLDDFKSCCIEAAQSVQ